MYIVEGTPEEWFVWFRDHIYLEFNHVDGVPDIRQVDVWSCPWGSTDNKGCLVVECSVNDDLPISVQHIFNISHYFDDIITNFSVKR